jgi:hypothetical protein
MSSSIKIYTAGYGAGWTPEQLKHKAEELDAVVIDTRLNPRSSSLQWDRKSLKKLLGFRYQHEGRFGNLNYKGGPIRLMDPAGALAGLVPKLLESNSTILLCGCRNVDTCHRKTVAELLAERFGLPIEHLAPPVSASAGTIKCLTIRQPWAWAIIHAGKDIENRTWATSYRGPLLIHAARGMTHDEYTDGSLFINKITSRKEPSFRTPIPGDLEFGGIIGLIDLVDCVTVSDSPWFTGPYGFVLRNPRQLSFYPMTGRLGLFDVPDKFGG